MPWPRQAAFTGGAVRVARGEVTWLGTDSPRLCAAVDRLRTQLPTLSIDCATTAPAYPQLGDEEGYRLEVDAAGSVRLDAPMEWGVLRGLATLVQLGRPGTRDIELPVAIIEDAPRFPWRGLMVDVARHFMSIEALHRTLEAMAFVKLNVLHLHLTDDQGFRFPSTAYPKLPEIGGGGEYYRIEELEELVARAAQLGIRVVPEIDVPGHVTSWLTAYPEFASRDTPLQPSERFGVHEAALDPANEFLYPALETLFREVAAIFPDAFLHIGGDEVEGSWWRDSLPIRRFMKDQAIPDNAGLHAHFNQRLSKQLRWLRRRVIGWDEVIDPALSDRVVIQSWRGARSRDRALQQGFDCVFSAGYYLDLFYPADIHYGFDPQATSEELDATEQAMIDDSRLAHVRKGLQWSRRFAEKAGNGPQASDRDPGRVLGGEACIWAELVTDELLDQRIWSRLPAIAERLWSAADVTDCEDMYRRLESVCERLTDVSDVDLASSQRKALARLGIDPVWTPLLDVLEPVKWYARLLGEAALAARVDGRELADVRPYATTTPLDRLVDVLPPESLRGRAINRRLDVGELSSGASRSGWLELARTWQGLPAGERAPAELGPLVEQLRGLGVLLENLSRGSVPDDARGTLAAGSKTHAELYIVVLPTLQRLVDALNA
jgi:hexosaminidase